MENKRKLQSEKKFTDTTHKTVGIWHLKWSWLRSRWQSATFRRRDRRWVDRTVKMVRWFVLTHCVDVPHSKFLFFLLTKTNSTADHHWHSQDFQRVGAPLPRIGSGGIAPLWNLTLKSLHYVCTFHVWSSVQNNLGRCWGVHAPMDHGSTNNREILVRYSKKVWVGKSNFAAWYVNSSLSRANKPLCSTSDITK